MPEQTLKISRIEVDRETCISVAACIDVAPEVFELDEEGKARVKNREGHSVDTILEAAKSCPVSAIRVFDEQGKKIWPFET